MVIMSSTLSLKHAIKRNQSISMKQTLKQGTKRVRAKTNSKSNSNEEEEEEEEEEDVRTIEDAKRELTKGIKYGKKMKARFQSERVEDKGLPLADSLVLISASCAIAICSIQLKHTPAWLREEWLREIPRDVLPNFPAVVAACVHGSKLAMFWIVGALAAKAYEVEAYDADYPEAIKRTVKAGCFACGSLILVEQASLRKSLEEIIGRGASTEYEFGTNVAADLLINSKTSDLILDCFVSAISMLLWRTIRWNSSVPDDV